jgi:type II secretory pathway pseudopilin PulG
VGKLRKSSQGGFVFLDLLVAILIAGAAMVFLISNISTTIRTARRIEERIRTTIIERTEYAQDRSIFFTSAQAE